MASNYALMMDALRIYREAMRTFVVESLKAQYGDLWWEQGVAKFFKVEELERLNELLRSRTTRRTTVEPKVSELTDMLDISNFRQIVDGNWRQVFAPVLKDRTVLDSWIAEVTAARNALAHWAGGEVPRRDALRFVDTCWRVVESIDEKAAADIQAVYRELDSKHQEAGPAPEAPKPESRQPLPEVRGLSPWREVAPPHRDVREGRYVQAEFAANLAEVLAGTAEDEYGHPVEFFRRTHLTAGTLGLLRNSLQRLNGVGGEPVVQLKTAFGGGKTHTLLALYHLVKSPWAADEVPELRDFLANAGLQVPESEVAVLVGTALDAAQGRYIEDLGIQINTLWGEMAWQLGKQRAYAIVAENDSRGVAPGSDTLVRLFTAIGKPCAILIDELVAYMRNIRNARGKIAAGDFNANLTFIQSLTEAVTRFDKALVVAAVPESKIEVGDASGEEVLRRVEQTLGRLEAIWKPVEAEESFAIVRRRLFDEITDTLARDATCEAFSRMYRRSEHRTDFPVECRETAYERRMRESYPIHPEVFDRLYEDWSALERFQRTRGVLRLIAATAHELWQSNDRSALIMPGSLPLYAPRVRDELTRYLADQWNAVIDTDVDGEGSEPRAIETENIRYGQLQAARRVARTIFLGSVPAKAAKGLEDVRIKLGAVQPGENVSVFSDAMARLRDRLSHLYHTDQGRYWLDVQTNLTRTVADRANKLDDWKIWQELEDRVRQLRDRAQFARVHPCPAQSADVPDEAEARLVLVSPKYAHHRGSKDSAALDYAREILESRGTSPRRFRNMLLFVATDEESLARLQEETRRYLAWKSIQEDADQLGLDRTQREQASRATADGNKTLTSLVDSSYAWLLVPTQEGTNPIEWEALPLAGGDLDSVGNLIQRASSRAISHELLVPSWSPIHLRRELDTYLWKDGRPHIKVKEVWEALATYVYFPRLTKSEVLLQTIKDGVRTKDFFGYALVAESDGTYKGLVFGESTASVYYDDAGVLVRPEVAGAAATRSEIPVQAPTPGPGAEGPLTPGPVPGPAPASAMSKRFYGRVHLNPQRMASGAGQVSEEVLQHLAGLLGADVQVELDITVRVPEGIPERIVRTVSENAKTLKFDDFGFEEE